MKVCLLGSGAIPSTTKSTVRNQTNIAIGHKCMGNLVLVPELLVVNCNPQTGRGLYNRLYFGVGQIAKRQAVGGNA